MKFWELLYKIAKDENINTTDIGPKVGLSRTYIASQKGNNVDLRISNACKLLNACDYGLYAIKRGYEPSGAIEITECKR